jgi:glycosyl transferase family 2
MTSHQNLRAPHPVEANASTGATRSDPSAATAVSPAGPAPPILAIIIPAYKGRHLAHTLDSFAAQTDRRFRIYVGDDGSPDDIAAIVAPFRGRLDLIYRRFSENVGRRSLAQHWDRTIRLGNEPWLWLFSDDDIVSPDCVKIFLQRISLDDQTNALLRFQVRGIDIEGRPTDAVTAYPAFETWEDYTRRLLQPATWIILQNVIFRRSIYFAEGGFDDFPSGFGTDLIAWAKFGRLGGLETLPAGCVFYRQHPGSICHGFYFGPGDRTPMLAGMRHLLLALRQLGAQRGAPRLIPPALQLDYFCRQSRYVARPLDRSERAFALRTLRELWPTWFGVREVWFWWYWIGPRLRAFGWHRLARAWRQNLRTV